VSSTTAAPTTPNIAEGKTPKEKGPGGDRQLDAHQRPRHAVRPGRRLP
jgi:hypothetical protein